jgi:hypothetical protein
LPIQDIYNANLGLLFAAGNLKRSSTRSFRASFPRWATVRRPSRTWPISRSAFLASESISEWAVWCALCSV